MLSVIDVAIHLDRYIVHGLISKCITSREAYARLYEYMRLPPLLVNMPLLAGIDLWLLTRNPNWSDIARAAYYCGEENVMEQIFKCKIFTLYEYNVSLHTSLLHLFTVITPLYLCIAIILVAMQLGGFKTVQV